MSYKIELNTYRLHIIVISGLDNLNVLCAIINFHITSTDVQ